MSKPIKRDFGSREIPKWQTAPGGENFKDIKYVVGDDVIISGGENISLIEIENAISQSFASFEFAAFAISSQKWGQELHIAAVNAPAEFPDQVAMLLVEKFGNAAKPKGFHQLTALPLIGIGKVDRGALAQLAMKSEF